MITLVLGGARSGKSELAERICAASCHPVTYMAAGPITDPDFAARVALHRERRPSAWTTVEAGKDLVASLDGIADTVLIDSLGTWVSASPDFAVDVDALCRALQDRAGDSVVVSEEVGLGVHPLRDRLAASAIAVRDCTSFGMPGVVRIAVPGLAELTRLEEAMCGAG